MLKLGEKGSILQNDNQTYALAPHIPCDVVTPELLRRIAEVSEHWKKRRLDSGPRRQSWGQATHC